MNTYREASELLIDGTVIYSMEGTTQADPLAVGMYAIGTPLIRRLSDSVTQVWYADGAAAAGSLENFRGWWNELVRIGPSCGYYPNHMKSWLITKEDRRADAMTAFDDTNINILCSSHSYLGSPLRSSTFVYTFISEKIATWSDKIRMLTAIPLTHLLPSPMVIEVNSAIYL